MEGLTKKEEDNSLYKLEGYHYMLKSKRKLDNRFSLVYTNVIKHIANTFAEVPLLQHPDGNLNIKKKDEYEFHKDYYLSDYQDHMKKD